MNRRRLFPIAFAAVAAAQIALPAWWVAQGERTRSQGKIYRFRIEPYDPYDAFRGRYLSFRILAERVPLSRGEKLRAGDRAYAKLVCDADGFAKVAALLREPPGQGDYVAVKVLWRDKACWRVCFPFSRYFVAEDIAEDTQRALTERLRGKGQAYAVVRVLAGRAAIVDVVIDGRSVNEWARGQAEKSK